MTSFGDLQAFQDLPRLAGLALSQDGGRLVTTVAEPDPDRTRFRTALWEIDPAGERPARRLTRGTGESAPAFLPDGDLLFTSARPDPDRPSRPESPPRTPPRRSGGFRWRARPTWWARGRVGSPNPSSHGTRAPSSSRR